MSRPSGTLARPTIDVHEQLTIEAEKKVSEAKAKSERMLYQLTGVETEAYIGAEEVADRYPRWERVFVEIPDFPPFNLTVTSKSTDLSIGMMCPRCSHWVSRDFSTLWGLARIREAPVTDCWYCSSYLMRQTALNVWTKTLESEEAP